MCDTSMKSGLQTWSICVRFPEYNDGVKYLLTVIDILSTFGWMRPLKRKTGEEVAAAFKSIFKLGRKPKNIWVDKGREFYNKDVRGILGKSHHVFN